MHQTSSHDSQSTNIEAPLNESIPSGKGTTRLHANLRYDMFHLPIKNNNLVDHM